MTIFDMEPWELELLPGWLEVEDDDDYKFECEETGARLIAKFLSKNDQSSFEYSDLDEFLTAICERNSASTSPVPFPTQGEELLGCRAGFPSGNFQRISWCFSHDAEGLVLSYLCPLKTHSRLIESMVDAMINTLRFTGHED